MNLISSKVPILIAEDDQDDRFLLKEAMKAFDDVLDLYFVEDGEKLMDFLHSGGGQSDPALPQPRLILLNLQMPRKDGREALVEIKQDASLRQIPIVVWTTSAMEDEKRFCLESGAEDYVTKPNNIADLESAVRAIVKRWLHVPVPRGQ